MGLNHNQFKFVIFFFFVYFNGFLYNFFFLMKLFVPCIGFEPISLEVAFALDLRLEFVYLSLDGILQLWKKKKK